MIHKARGIITKPGQNKKTISQQNFKIKTRFKLGFKAGHNLTYSSELVLKKRSPCIL